jgi:hypothetical protein
MKTQSLVQIAKLTLTLSALMLTACNKGMQSAGGSSSAGGSGGGGGGTAQTYDLQSALEKIDAVPVQSSAGPAKVSFQANLNADFGDAAKILNGGEKLVKAAMWPVDCARVGTILDLRPENKQYECGEVPYGKILDNKRKEVFVFDFEGLNGKENGVEYRVSKATIPLILMRDQQAGSSSLVKLTTNKLEGVSIPQEIMESIYYRLSPENGTLRSDICAFIPGLELGSTEQKVTVHAQKKVLWIIKLKGSADIHVQPGTMSFKSAKVCSTFRSSAINTAGKFKPWFRFEKIAAPEFENLKFKGLDVNVKVNLSGILKIISSILKIVGFNLEKKIAKMVEEAIVKETGSTIEKVTKNDIETGKWLEKYVNAELFKGKVVNELEKKTGPSMDAGGPGSEADLSAQIEAACKFMAQAYPGAHLENQFEQLCRSSFQIKLQFFIDNPADRAKGCYDAFFAADEAKSNPWWKKGCKIRNTLEVIAPAPLAPFYDCVITMITDSPKAFLTANACKDELDLAKAHLSTLDIAQLVELARVVQNQRAALKDYKEKIDEKYQDWLAQLPKVP